MRRNEKEIKDRAEIDSLLRLATILRLGLSDNGAPYVVPLNYGYDGKCIYFHSAKEGKKLDIIHRNNRVSFEIDGGHELVKTGLPCTWSWKYWSVIGSGRAYIVEDTSEKKIALSNVVSHYAETSYRFTDDDIKRVTVIRIEIENVTGKRSGK